MIYIKENRGGRVRVSVGSTFTMKDNASVFGNTANSATNANWGHEGGGVYVDYSGAFRFAGGTIYGSNADEELKNSAEEGSALYVSDWSEDNTVTWGPGGMGNDLETTANSIDTGHTLE